MRNRLRRLDMRGERRCPGSNFAQGAEVRIHLAVVVALQTPEASRGRRVVEAQTIDDRAHPRLVVLTPSPFAQNPQAVRLAIRERPQSGARNARAGQTGVSRGTERGVRSDSLLG